MSEVVSVFFELYIKGVKLDDTHRRMCTSIEYTDNATGSDSLKIVIGDPDFVYIEDTIFVEETPVRFIGKAGDNEVEFEGYISVIDIEYPESGFPTLVIHSMDNTHLMNRVAKKRTWENTRHSEVAKQIFSEYGFKAVVDPSPIEGVISQSNTTDIQFLADSAKRQLDDFICYVKGNTGYYVKKNVLQTPKIKLGYKTGDYNLLTFRPRINKEIKQVEIKVSNVNLETGKVETDVANDSTSKDMQGVPVNASGYRLDVHSKEWEKIDLNE